MQHPFTRRRFLLSAAGFTFVSSQLPQRVLTMTAPPQLLTDPFLQLPTSTSVRVVWFTEFSGKQHTVNFGANLGQVVTAKTTQLSRVAEDADSNLGTRLKELTRRGIWRHEAEVTGLAPNQRIPYRVTSVREDGAVVTSNEFSLAPAPAKGTPLTILLTSDHQLKPMVAANLQKVAETIGQLDLVLFAGDLVNVPDRASEWFDDSRQGAFFPALQGRAQFALEKNGVTTTYQGAPIIQHTPMYTAIGNHEVMGRFSTIASLRDQFGNAYPRQIATQQADAKAVPIFREFDQPQTITIQINASDRDRWIKNNSFNTDTYEELFTLPTSRTGGKRYYSTTFGDVALIVLYITNVWRTPNIKTNEKGKYHEGDKTRQDPENWGWGQFIFESIQPGSEQYQWLVRELEKPEFQQAKYRIVMFHHPPHSLGENSVPAYTDPKPKIERQGRQVQAVRYEYPKATDYIIRDVVPLLEQANVQLVFYGHSHLWNRFVSPTGMHFLETSNVGNSYGAYINGKQRFIPEDLQGLADYTLEGNPNGLEPITPTIAPLFDEAGQPVPYVASNDITVFSILDTGTGTISSYRFDTREPNSAVVKFDEFRL